MPRSPARVRIGQGLCREIVSKVKEQPSPANKSFLIETNRSERPGCRRRRRFCCCRRSCTDQSHARAGGRAGGPGSLGSPSSRKFPAIVTVPRRLPSACWLHGGTCFRGTPLARPWSCRAEGLLASLLERPSPCSLVDGLSPDTHACSRTVDAVGSRCALSVSRARLGGGLRSGDRIGIFFVCGWREGRRRWPGDGRVSGWSPVGARVKRSGVAGGSVWKRFVRVCTRETLLEPRQCRQLLATLCLNLDP